MKIKLLSFLLAIFILICTLPSCTLLKDESIAILYENDVHCAVEGYSTLAAIKTDFGELYDHVGVVSVGDFVQGGSLGTISQGEYIVNLMNIVGYDALTLGNHEFDYKLPRLLELTQMMKTKPVCANLQKISDGSEVFEPYSIVSYGKIDIAYIGITTPSTISSSSPIQFKDENGDYIYTFNPNSLYDILQKNINAAKKEGADYIIALTHLGTEDGENYTTAIELAENTHGLDAFIDGHSHHTVQSKEVTDKNGNPIKDKDGNVVVTAQYDK